MKISEILAEIGIGKARSFKGSPCKTNCTGHSAGYLWAKKKNLKNKNQCPASPAHPSFMNGCRIAGDEQSNKPR